MKHGLLIYRTNPDSNIFNIGDYIQSLAAAQFYDNKIDVYLNREKLNEYHGDDVKLIMNGWFMHEPQNWPPSERINPLFVAFHINKLAQNELTSSESISYLKKFQPIGCRDYNTVHMLQDKGVHAYFSGCMTLTLGLMYKSSRARGTSVYFTDVPIIVSHTLKTYLNVIKLAVFNLNSVLAIHKNRRDGNSIKDFIKTLFFVEKYSKVFTLEVLKKAVYLKQEIPDNFKSEDEKFSYAKKLLNLYSEARFVVTSRIHCALPCLALETPVLFVNYLEQPEVSKCRMSGLIELFHTIDIGSKSIKVSLPVDKIDLNFSFENKNLYKKYSESLCERVREFTKCL